MSRNEDLWNQVFEYLKVGELFVFVLFEKEYGVDIYFSEMWLVKQFDGIYLVNGFKYYIGNVNKVRMICVFGVEVESKEYVWFVVDVVYFSFYLEKNVIYNQVYVVVFDFIDYFIIQKEILYLGCFVWDVVLNMVNFNKYNLGWGSIGICIYVLYEVINYVVNCWLFDYYVMDFFYI